jgi:hypothetical protein
VRFASGLRVIQRDAEPTNAVPEFLLVGPQRRMTWGQCAAAEYVIEKMTRPGLRQRAMTVYLLTAHAGTHDLVDPEEELEDENAPLTKEDEAFLRWFDAHIDDYD